MVYLISQILTVIADAFFFAGMLSKSKKWLLVCLICSNVLFATHYFLLKAITGAFILVADTVFLVVTFFLNKRKKENQIFYISILFVWICGIITYLTWNGPISLLPMVGMSTYFVLMGVKHLYISKIGGATRNLCNIIYMFLIASYVGASLEIILFISAISGCFLNLSQSKKIALQQQKDGRQERAVGDFGFPVNVVSGGLYLKQLVKQKAITKEEYEKLKTGLLNH